MRAAQELVMVFIDYENIRRGLAENFQEQIKPSQIVKTMSDLASEIGEFRGGMAFGDWTLRPEDARAIEEYGFQAYNVLLTRGGKDRSDPPMMLEMYDAMHEKPQISAFIVGSGDSGFKEIVRRGRERGKRMYICAVGLTIAREFLTLSSGVFPLKDRLGLTPKAEATILGKPLASVTRDWSPFVRRLNSLEGALPHVICNYLINSILEASMGCGDTKEEKQQFLEEAASTGLIEFYDVPNPKLPSRTVRACRLKREATIVIEILSKK
jgi:hypothetical protein